VISEHGVPHLRVLGLLLLLGCGETGRSHTAFSKFDPGRAPPEFQRGERLYNSYCQSCHGLYGRGEGLGPPLLDSMYSSSVLPDEAIFIAVERGVRQHNFNFGAMPPVKRLSRPETEPVVGYIRWLQGASAAQFLSPHSNGAN
jgi:mono/diheme cytochrome c family protein